MLTVYSERDLIEALRGAAAGEGKDAHDGVLLEKLVSWTEAFYEGGPAACDVSL